MPVIIGQDADIAVNLKNRQIDRLDFVYTVLAQVHAPINIDLLPTDIIKSDVIGKIHPDNQDDYNEIWEELEVETGRDGFAEVFGHIRMIYAKDKARRALLEEFRERVISKESSSEDLVDKVIAPYTQAYLVAKHAQYVSTESLKSMHCFDG